MRLHLSSYIAVILATPNIVAISVHGEMKNKNKNNYDLQLTMLAGYQPASNISIISTIDLDVAALVSTLGVGNYVDAAKAYNSGTNVPGLTLASMSTTAQAIMGGCGVRCPYSTFSKFLTYYGHADYGHRIAQSAFDMTPTQGLLRLNNDFSNITNAARAGTFQSL